MQFGFSYVGLTYLLLLIVPNLIWTKNQPEDYAKYARNEKKALLALERAGEALVSCTVLIFEDFNLRPWSPWSWRLASSVVILGAGHIGIHWMHRREAGI